MADVEQVVLVIEDEAPIRRFLRSSLTGHGYKYIEAVTGKEGLAQAATRQPDLIILDLGLPDMDGVDVIRQLREWTTLPVVVLSVRGNESDKIGALDAGADDYLTKPFGVGELLARIRVILRHAARLEHKPEEPVFTFGDVRVDLENRQISVGENEVHLTPFEYRLLITLIRYAGKVVTHRQLLKEVWGPSSIEQHPYLRIFILNLRRKLEDNPTRPHYLITEPGVGYRLRGE